MHRFNMGAAAPDEIPGEILYVGSVKTAGWVTVFGRANYLDM